MNRTVILAGIMISLIVFWLIGFVNGLNEDIDVSHKIDKKASSSKSHMTMNSFGDEVLLLSGLSMKEKKRLWNDSNLKLEMLELFPHFMEMKAFVEEYVEDDGTFKDELLRHMENIEFEYIGGSMSGEKAKASLSKLR